MKCQNIRLYWDYQLIFINTVIYFYMDVGFIYCSLFFFSSSLMLLIENPTFIASILLMQWVPWIIIICLYESRFYIYPRERFSAISTWQLISSSLSSCNTHLALIYNIGIHFDASLLQGPALFLPVGLSYGISTWWVLRPHHLAAPILF